MSPSTMLTSLPTVMTPSSFGYNPPSYGMAPSSSYGMVQSSSYGISSSGYNPTSSYVVTPSSYVVTPSTYSGFHHVKQVQWRPKIIIIQSALIWYNILCAQEKIVVQAVSQIPAVFSKGDFILCLIVVFLIRYVKNWWVLYKIFSNFFT